MAISEGEKKALKETLAERAKARKSMTPEQFAQEVLDKIASMAPADRAIDEKVHGLGQKVAPGLQAKTWYGMQAYCDATGKTILFFQDAGKFKSRYSTLGFQDTANLDEDLMWATSFAVLGWNADVEKKITELVKRAIS
jgi:uncharacterized protein YdhG (YjbR/CyaY superfamily)